MEVKKLKKFALSIALGYSLHIAVVEVADLMLASRMIACASGDVGACVVILTDEQSLFERVVRARPELGRRRWQRWLEKRGFQSEE